MPIVPAHRGSSTAYEAADGGNLPVLAVDQHGNRLMSLTSGNEHALPEDAPVPLALVALWHDERVLMVFDRFRQQWELPGGGIEPGETPRQAALRELAEETGQSPDGPLRFLGYPRFALKPALRTEYAALFTGHTSAPREFQANDEIAATCWWDLEQPLRGRAQPLDVYLARLAKRDCENDGHNRITGSR